MVDRGLRLCDAAADAGGAAVKRGCYRLADHTVEFRTLYGKIHAMCRDYATDTAPQLIIETTPEDIAFERERSTDPYADAYLETLAVYRKLAHALLWDDVLLFHASAVAVDGEAYLFTAVSGTGKSTHARLWRELLGERAVMVNDDKPLLHVLPERVEVYGTPWSGKHALHTNMHVPVRAICLLRRAEENVIEPITPYAALPMLLQQTYRPTEQTALLRTLRLVERLGETVRLFSMGCNMETDAASLAYETMSR